MAAEPRFPGRPHWSDGWGWTLFTPADLKSDVSTDSKKDCVGCHEAAKVG